LNSNYKSTLYAYNVHYCPNRIINSKFIQLTILQSFKQKGVEETLHCSSDPCVHQLISS